MAASQSTRTGRAPRCSITAPVAVNVMGEVITSSPGRTPTASSARCSAAVQDVTARACRQPRKPANASSNASARGPVVSQPDRRHSTTAAISSSPSMGTAKGRNSFRTWGSARPGATAGAWPRVNWTDMGSS